MKTNPGRFFEDYRLGETIVHAVPRTVSGGERALYHALYPAPRKDRPPQPHPRRNNTPANPAPARFHSQGETA